MGQITSAMPYGISGGDLKQLNLLLENALLSSSGSTLSSSFVLAEKGGKEIRRIRKAVTPRDEEEK